MAWKILLTAPAFAKTGEAASRLLRGVGCEIISSPSLNHFQGEQLTKALSGVDALLAGLDVCSASLLDLPAASNLKIIARWGVGFDSVDLLAATRNGIVVTNTPGLLDEAVADYTFTLLLASARQVHKAHFTVEQGKWLQSWGVDVHGKTLGLIGYGRIGRAVARRASGFNMRVLACDPTPPADSNVTFVSLDTLLAESDFVSLHAALTPQSRGLIGEAQLRRMKPTAWLINAARGALVDEAALSRALHEGWIAGAALDVFESEPLPAGCQLRSAPNVLLSPHQSSYGRETGERVSLFAAQSIVDLMNGRRPQSVVNPEVLASPKLRARIHA